jgi:hypothetical protein
MIPLSAVTFEGDVLRSLGPLYEQLPSLEWAWEARAAIRTARDLVLEAYAYRDEHGTDTAYEQHRARAAEAAQVAHALATRLLSGEREIPLVPPGTGDESVSY